MESTDARSLISPLPDPDGESFLSKFRDAFCNVWTGRAIQWSELLHNLSQRVPDIYKLVRRIDLIQYVIAKHFWQVTIRKWDQEVQALLGTTLYLYCATFWAMRLFYLFPAISGTYVTTSDASASGQRDREISDMKAPNWEHPLWFWTKIWSKQKISQVKNAQGNAKLFMGTLICFHTWGAIHHSHNSFN